MAVIEIGKRYYSKRTNCDVPLGFEEDTFAGTLSIFCIFCSDVIMPGDKVFHWQSLSPHPHITAHARCVARNKSGLLSDINKCCEV